ncbi:MAG: 1-aminocyclopropane-1-carboxylate deaminase [Gammaproteobacteria bacterium HGW-Gammaproteobacteria-3]|nr:MAG: 1-aminocyclopropane-1-carboxylate deaminase [Gammaproteobacteria bacterium HGW-Gammaproteobacteria-3]
MHPDLIKLENKFNRSILTKVDDPCLQGVELWIKRDDLLHPIISGNKWRKLKYILNHALSLNCKRIISMGGAYSNHLHALAFIGHELGLETVGLIRGERQSTPTLTDLQRAGMQLNFVSREKYRTLRQYKSWQALPGLTPTDYWLPEGGAVALALTGVAELVAEIDQAYDIICLPCGTGTTLAGVIQAVPETIEVWGFAALKGAGFLTRDIEQLLPAPRDNWRLSQAYHFGGFARGKPELTAFIKQFRGANAIPLEPVYTGKMLYGLYDLIEQGRFKPGQRIIAIHTGGLQGNRGFD